MFCYTSWSAGSQQCLFAGQSSSEIWVPVQETPLIGMLLSPDRLVPIKVERSCMLASNLATTHASALELTCQGLLGKLQMLKPLQHSGTHFKIFETLRLNLKFNTLHLQWTAMILRCLWIQSKCTVYSRQCTGEIHHTLAMTPWVKLSAG